MNKGLKALEIIKNAMTIYVGCASNIYTRYPFECNDIEKELKALEIIKRKKVNIKCIISGWLLGKYNSYKAHISLTQEEYDLLKEILL